MTEHERFEKTMSDVFDNTFNFSKFPNGEYKSAGPYIMWEVWQAARRWISVEEELPKEETGLTNANNTQTYGTWK